MEVTHIRKMNYINWIQDMFRLLMIGSVLIAIDALAMTTVISNEPILRMLMAFFQIGYIVFYMAKLMFKKDPTYWTYIKVKHGI